MIFSEREEPALYLGLHPYIFQSLWKLISNFFFFFFCGCQPYDTAEKLWQMVKSGVEKQLSKYIANWLNLQAPEPNCLHFVFVCKSHEAGFLTSLCKPSQCYSGRDNNNNSAAQDHSRCYVSLSNVSFQQCQVRQMSEWVGSVDYPNSSTLDYTYSDYGHFIWK